MRLGCAALAGFVAVVAACGGSGPTSSQPPAAPQIALHEVLGVAAGLSAPTDLQVPPGDSRIFVAERVGRLRVVQGGAVLPTPFLDISSRVFTDDEAGLLSFAFHPQFASGQPFVFVHFVERVAGTNGNVVVERYRVSAGDPNVLDPATAQVVIRIPHAMFSNHYGGRVAFGPDGMFYLSVGDGGSAGDPFGNGQNPAVLLGKILRLDVAALPYSIPQDNPVWPGAGRNENWAIGLRNPWRYAFDSGSLYIADVGQDQREEIDVAPAGAAGLNYGWNIFEGTSCFSAPCTADGLVAPVHDYGHDEGCSIIGGYVYRGAAVPRLQGWYVFSDLCGGFIRALRVDPGGVVVTQTLVDVGSNPQSFGVDGAGEIYVLTAEGRVLRVTGPSP